ncbi:MAG TPA: DUF3261 domain-containing protein [Kiritimatiellia bacterium]|nr:DUF3261 domain-containing protein [Kiritimatiellia bacterium]
MKKALTGFLAMAGLWLSGCATAPFPRPEPFAATGVAPEQVPAAFADRLAPRFEQAQALVFRFYLREIAALGYLSVDRAEGTFAMACLNPVGIKLFELVGTNGEVSARFVAPEIEKYGGELAQAAGTDLMRAYFNWLPPADASCRRSRNRLIFTAADAAGQTEYRYAGRDGFLAEKIRFEGRRVLWKVEYRDYRCGADGWIPTGLVIHNWRYGYRLVVQTKESEAP